MRVTREDVAARAGVSSVTVSSVLNKSRPVSQKTVKKVMQAIAELDYHPDDIARSMVKGVNKQLSVIVNDIVNPVQGEVVLGFEAAAIEQGYFVNVCTTLANIDAYIRSFISRRNDGVYITAFPERFAIENLYRLYNNGIKIVTSQSIVADDPAFGSVESDFKKGITELAEYLRETGHSRIAMLSAFSRGYKYDNRADLFCQAVMRQIPNAVLTVIEGEPPYPSDVASGRRLTEELLKSGRNFTAVFCTNDLMAYGCMAELRKAGLRVPRDVSVIGVDDITLSAIYSPPLTTIGYDKFELGARAFKALQEDIETGETSRCRLDTQLIVRESSGRAR